MGARRSCEMTETEEPMPVSRPLVLGVPTPAGKGFDSGAPAPTPVESAVKVVVWV